LETTTKRMERFVELASMGVRPGRGRHRISMWRKRPSVAVPLASSSYGMSLKTTVVCADSME